MLLGAPSAGDGACGTLAEALHEREQVVVEVTVVKQPRTVRQPHVQPHGKRAAKPLIVRAKQFVGHSEVLGKPRLAGVVGLVPAGKPRRNREPQRSAAGHRECRFRWPALRSGRGDCP
jgi:hypothetical protein